MQSSMTADLGSPGALRKSQERIYNSQQLLTALRSALAAVRDQLSVLSILDSTASSWPGIQQATEDLEFLVDMSGKVTARMEHEAKQRDEELADVKVEVNTLKETLSLQQSGKEQLARELAAATKELKATSSSWEAAKQEVAAQKQELWALEKQRADLASEMERVKQDNEFMEGEISTLRATVTEQMSQITELKEDLAGRKADVGHLQQLASDQKVALEHSRTQADEAAAQLRDTRAALSQAQLDREHHEREADRLHEEVARLAAQLDKTTKELERVRDWGEVLRKVEGDKLREEQDARATERLELEGHRAALDKRLATAQAQLSHADDKLRSKEAEVEALKKQLGLAAVTTKGLQADVATLAAERNAAQQQRDNAAAHITKLTAQISQLQLAAVQAEKAHTAALVAAREEVSMAAAHAKATAEDSRREAAVQKALSDGWSRDLRLLEDKLHAEADRCAALQARVDELARGEQEGRMDSMKLAANAESRLQVLQQQLDGAQLEIRKLKAEHSSERKRMEKQVEALQRECDESAQEVKRLRVGEVPHLPVLRQPVTMQDELNNLKKMLGSFAGPAAANSSLPSRLPALPQGRQLQAYGSGRVTTR